MYNHEEFMEFAAQNDIRYDMAGEVSRLHGVYLEPARRATMTGIAGRQI
jgi:hypothetical protein